MQRVAGRLGVGTLAAAAAAAAGLVKHGERIGFASRTELGAAMRGVAGSAVPR